MCLSVWSVCHFTSRSKWWISIWVIYNTVHVCSLLRMKKKGQFLNWVSHDLSFQKGEEHSAPQDHLAKWWSYPTTAASWCSSCGPWGRRATSVTAPSWWETVLIVHINWCWLHPACSSGRVHMGFKSWFTEICQELKAHSRWISSQAINTLGQVFSFHVFINKVARTWRSLMCFLHTETKTVHCISIQLSLTENMQQPLVNVGMSSLENN